MTATAPFVPRYPDLVTLLSRTVAEHAARPLFGTKAGGAWSWITYGDFAAIVDRARGGLARLGVGAEDRVAIIANNRVEWAAAAYATYGRGGAFVPMYEAQQAKEWVYILNDCGAKLVFAGTRAIADTLAAAKPNLPTLAHIVCLDAGAGEADSWAALLASGSEHPVPVYSVEPATLAGYIYTSGTTGQPKGVLLTHRNLASNVSAALDVFPLNSIHRSLSFLPWAHSFGQVAELHTLLGAGASMGLCEGVAHIIPNLAEVRPSVLLAVPNIFNRIYDGVQKQMTTKPRAIRKLFKAGMAARSKQKKGEPLALMERIALELAQRLIFTKIIDRFGGRLQFAISGGAALSREVAEFVDNLGIMVFEGYGLTETSPVATCNSPTERRIGTAGKAIPGVEIRLDHTATSDPDEGEIVVYGHNVMKGYYNLPEDTAKVFTGDGGFRTGDLGKFDADGFLWITGRLKELYKLENGKYIAPVALEGSLQLSPLILQACVYGANRPKNVAVIVPDSASLLEWAKQHNLPADISALVKLDSVKSLIRSEIEVNSSSWKHFERVADFVLTAEEFTVQNDLLTPKLSMKRRNVVTRHEAALEALYKR